jgi:hypothetical protein
MQVEQPEYNWLLNIPPAIRRGPENVEFYNHSPILIYSTQCLRNGKLHLYVFYRHHHHWLMNDIVLVE